MLIILYETLCAKFSLEITFMQFIHRKLGLTKSYPNKVKYNDQIQLSSICGKNLLRIDLETSVFAFFRAKKTSKNGEKASGKI